MHVLGCLWVHQVYSNYDSNISGWYEYNYGRDDPETAEDELQERARVRWNVYVDSAYFILVTMSSVGYGDMLPITTDERMTAVCVIILGTFVWAYIIGSFTATIAVMGEDKARYESKMRGTAELLKFLEVDDAMLNSINHYYGTDCKSCVQFIANDPLPCYFQNINSPTKRCSMSNKFIMSCRLS